MKRLNAKRRFLWGILGGAGMLLILSYAPRVHAAGYQYRRIVTVSSTAISPASGTALTNFPLLISGTFPYLAASSSIAASGTLQDANGYDVMFSSDPSGTHALNYETESYSSSTGSAVYWVQVPTLSSSSNQIYMFYDNPGITTSQAHPSSVWNSSYEGVWHFPGSASFADDSTVNGYSGIVYGAATTTTGMIDGALSIPNTTNVGIGVNGPVFVATSSPFTVSTWVKLSTYNSSNLNVIAELQTTSTDSGLFIDEAGLSGYEGVSLGAAGGNWATVRTGTVLPTSTWQYVSITYNGAGATTVNNFQIYLNGALQNATSGGTYGTGSNGTMLGNDVGGDLPLAGSLDEFRISNTVRSADWIATNYNNQSNPGSFVTLASAQQTTPIVNSFSVASSSITLDGSATLSWNASNISTLSISGNSLTLSTSTSSGTVSVTPNAAGTFTYTLTATGINGTSTATTTLVVNPVPVSGPVAVVTVPSNGFVASSSHPSGSSSSTSTPSSTPPSVNSSTSSSSSSSSTSTLQATLASLEAELQILRTRAALSTISSSLPTRNLFWGDHGQDVAALQKYLITYDAGPLAKKLASVGATGYFGNLTLYALAEYQKSVGITPAVGYFGPLTRARMMNN